MQCLIELCLLSVSVLFLGIIALLKICLFPYVGCHSGNFYKYDTTVCSVDFRSAGTQKLIIQTCAVVPHRQRSALAGRRSIALHCKSSPVVFLLQPSRESHCRDAALLKVSEGTIGVGGRKHKKFCLRVRMGGGL